MRKALLYLPLALLELIGAPKCTGGLKVDLKTGQVVDQLLIKRDNQKMVTTVYQADKDIYYTLSLRDNVILKHSPLA